MRFVPVALVATALLAGCAVGSSGVDAPSSDLPRGLAATPNTTVPQQSGNGSANQAGGGATPTTGSGGGSSGSGTGSGSGSGSGPGGTGGSTTSPAPLAPFHSIGQITDRTDDRQGSGPAWADLKSIEIADNGTYCRVTVVVAATLPSHVPAYNTLGVGVDFYRGASQTEGQYQLFADGEPDGWFAYVHGPDGYTKYPGTFAVGGNRLVFTVPWSALSDRRSGRFSAFADWSKSTGSPHPYSEDHAPQLLNTAYG